MTTYKTPEITIKLPWWIFLALGVVLHYMGFSKVWVIGCVLFPAVLNILAYAFSGWVILRALRLKKIRLEKVE